MVSYLFRANIERSYGQEIAQLRIQYTQEDKEVIDQYLKAKRSFSLESEAHVETEDLLGNNSLSLSPPLSLSLSLSLSLHTPVTHQLMQVI